MEAESTPPVIPPVIPPSTPHDVASRSLFRSPRFWIPAIICASSLLSVPIAFVIGAIIGNTQIYRNLSKHQQSRIEAFLAQHPDSFGDLTVEHASNGWAYPVGTVPHQSDYDMLAEGLHKRFGDELGDEMMCAVETEAAP